MTTPEITAETRKTLEAILAKHGDDSFSVIGLLQEINTKLGYLPEDVLREVCRRKGIPVSLAYSLATFYSSFRLEAMGKHHVCVCVGTACHVRGAAKVVESIERELGVAAGRTTADGQFTLDTVNCVGACAMGPLVLIDDQYHGGMDQKKIGKLIRKYSGEAPEAE